MVNFQDQRLNGQATLVISSKRSNHKVTLAVNDPIVSRNPPKLIVSYHERNWTPEHKCPPSKVWTLLPGMQHRSSEDALPTLGNRILNAEVSWGSVIDFDGEFTFLKGYWEWAEDILNFCSKPLKDGAIYDAVYASLFTYDCNANIIKAFCEAWCPRTNTLVTSSGELSISPQDLHILGGLPLSGDIYDEHIPSALDLSKGSNKCRASLFEAFYRLNQQEDDTTYVQASRWIDFWCRKARKYTAPPPSTQKEARKSRLRSTHNPSGILDASARWSDVSETPFVELGISRHLEQEAYLAAFLSCWLCVFVLPGTPTETIRPETFKMACTMARGNKVCLAAPVLASIYSGLNSISESHYPGQIGDPFPIHYVYGWLAAYYQTHFKTPGLTLSNPKMVTNSGEGGAKYYNETDARKKIFKGDVSWLCTSRKNDRDFTFRDNRKGSKEDFEYFICLRPSFLILRQGDQCKAEPYIPHRFSRQFGFYQADAPGLLAKDIRHVSLTEGFRLHRQYDNINSQSQATFPMSPHAPKKHFSDKYKAWLAKVHTNLLENRIKDIVINGNPNTPVGEERTQEQRDQLTASRKGKAPAQQDTSTRGPSPRYATQRRREEQVRPRSPGEDATSDDDQDRCWKRPKGRPLNQGSAELYVSNDAQSSNHHSSMGQSGGPSNPPDLEVASHRSMPPSNAIHQEARPELSQASILPGGESFISYYMNFIASLWNTICKNLSEVPIDTISSFRGSVEDKLKNMKRDGVDLSALEQRVAEFFKKAEDYDQVRSQLSNAMPTETRVEELRLARGALEEAQQAYFQTEAFLLDQQKTLKDSTDREALLEKTIKDAQEELEKIRAKNPDLQDRVTKAQGQHNTSQKAVTAAEKEFKRIRDSPMLTDEDEVKLALIKRELEAHKEDLMNFRIL